ncbi:MAG: GNAT family N-acetyltransferase [Clostridia bacterium]|nr:GNAT family N-acetyltransferase [Clostridia bacterium]
MIRICEAEGAQDIEDVRVLFKDYALTMELDLCFQNFEEELAALPGKYALPTGYLLLAKDQDKSIGCVAVRKIDDGVCEMKRLYVKSQYRGMKIGKRLAEEIIEKARELGYDLMKLDTLFTMKEAVALYKLLGFKETQAYTFNPSEDVIYMELNLNKK